MAIMSIYGYKDGDPYLSAKVSHVKKNVLRTPIAKVFESAGVDKVTVAAKLKELLEAEDYMYQGGKVVTGSDGNPIKRKDFKTQLSATALVANILGLLQKGASVDVHKQTNNLIVMVEDEVSARARVDEDTKRNEIISKSYRVEGDA